MLNRYAESIIIIYIDANINLECESVKTFTDDIVDHGFQIHIP